MSEFEYLIEENKKLRSHLKMSMHISDNFIEQIQKLQAQLDEANKVVEFAYDNEEMDVLICLKKIQKRSLEYLEKYKVVSDDK
jgi:cell fate (sporulation/competence/biofilm development) regulator YlbF (YheA/YmcA/DUF963 family)